MRTTEHAYAKVNLYLQVDGKREDGFHELQTVMHTVGLCDDLAVHIDPKRENRVHFSSNAPYLPTDSRNLAVRAAECFKELTGLSFYIRIDMKKRIPVAAGLAGGSSDAAAVLRACNRLCGYPLSPDELCALGARLGSDVAFCIRGGTALCGGRGEKMTPLSLSLVLPFVVATAQKEHVSTPAAFSLLDREYHDFDGSIQPLRASSVEKTVEALQKGDIGSIASCMHNDFEDVILPTCPGAKKIKERIMEEGALSSMMSGSGPSVFGLFPDYATALRAASAIGNGAHCVLSTPPLRLQRNHIKKEHDKPDGLSMERN